MGTDFTQGIVGGFETSDFTEAETLLESNSVVHTPALPEVAEMLDIRCYALSLEYGNAKR